MKIYISNFNIDILDIVLKRLNEQYIDSETYIQIYSTDGIYRVNDKIVNKLKCIDKDIQIYEKYYENFTLIVDTSYYELENVNAIHSEHISRCIKRSFFKLNKNSNLQLVIEGIILDKLNSNKSKYENIKSNDIYFELQNSTDINDALVKKELIVFLSLLNNIVI
jgi:hypothetical protein